MGFRNLIDHAFAAATTERLDITPPKSIDVGYYGPRHSNIHDEGLYVEIGGWGVQHYEPRRTVDIGVGRGGKIHFGKTRVHEREVVLEDSETAELVADTFEIGTYITAHPRVSF